MMKRNLCTGDAKEGEGGGEGGKGCYLMTRSLDKQTRSHHQQKHRAQVVCIRQGLAAKGKRKKSQRSSFIKSPSAIPRLVPAGGFDCISNHEGYRGLMEGKVSLLHQAVSLFPLELRHGSSVLCCACSIPQFELLNINRGRARKEML